MRAERTKRARKLACVVPADPEPPSAGAFLLTTGAWTSWWITGAMGLCPVPGSVIYLIGCPRFEQVSLKLGETGGTLTISAQRQPKPGDVVTAARLNGMPIERSWLRHDEITADSRLEIEIGPEPTSWGSSELPPFAI